jgi:hypothetical protein
MLDPSPYILNLTNIYLQVNYHCLVKQEYFSHYPHRTQQEDRKHIISEKTTHNLKFAPTITYCLDILSKRLFAKKNENRIIGFNNTTAHK